MPDLRKTVPVTPIVNYGCIAPTFLSFLVAGLALAGLAVCSSTEVVLAQRTWLPVTAKVSKFEIYPQGNKNVVKIRYEYVFHGKPYTSSAIGVSTWIRQDQLDDSNSNHYAGSSLTAFVNPVHPSEAAIEVGIPLMTTINFFFCIPFIAVGAAALSSFFPKRTRPLPTGWIGYLAVVWGLLAATFHLLAGQLSPAIWVIFLGYFFIVSSFIKEAFHPTKRRRKG